MIKEFNHIGSINGYLTDEETGRSLFWHNCLDAPVEMSRRELYRAMQENEHTCPVCKKFTEEWKRIDELTDEPCWFSNRFTQENKDTIQVVNTHKIVINSDDGKIRIDEYSTGFMMQDSEIIYKYQWKKRFTMNIKTGNTYTFRRNCPDFIRYRDNRLKIQNITYEGADRELPDAALKYICDTAHGMMKQIHGDDVPEFYLYGAELNFHNLLRYARCPYMDPVLFDNLYSMVRFNNYRAYRNSPRAFIVKNNCKDPVTHILKHSKIPYVKSLKRIAYEQAENIGLLAIISESFKDENNIRSLCNLFSKYYGYDDYPYCFDFSANIIKKMIKHKGENIITGKLKSLVRHEGFKDADNIIKKMIEDYDKLIDFDFDFSGRYNLYDLHMLLSYEVTKQESRNYEIPYTPGELALEKHDEDFILRPAKDTYELKDTGKLMSICVGSYSGDALRKDCSIFILYEKTGKSPVGCIELRGDKVYQVKGRYNSTLEGEPARFVERWIEENGLKTIYY